MLLWLESIKIWAADSPVENLWTSESGEPLEKRVLWSAAVDSAMLKERLELQALKNENEENQKENQVYICMIHAVTNLNPFGN